MCVRMHAPPSTNLPEASCLNGDPRSTSLLPGPAFSRQLTAPSLRCFATERATIRPMTRVPPEPTAVLASRSAIAATEARAAFPHKTRRRHTHNLRIESPRNKLGRREGCRGNGTDSASDPGGDDGEGQRCEFYLRRDPPKDSPPVRNLANRINSGRVSGLLRMPRHCVRMEERRFITYVEVHLLHLTLMKTPWR